MLLNLTKRILLFISLFYLLCSSCHANINGVHGVKHTTAGEVSCDTSLVMGLDPGSYFKAGACSLYASGYLPTSGQYRAKITLSTSNRDNAISTPFYIDSNTNLSAQNISTSGTDVPISAVISSDTGVHVCYSLLDSNNTEWALADGRDCSGKPIPPTPPAPPTSCSINNGNALNVNLGTLDRAQLVTVPGTGSARHFQIPITCTGDVSNIPVSMKVSYTPISVSGKEVIKSSANGLGVSIIYNGNILSTSTATPLSFVPGSNQLDLAFEAVRDPNVTVGSVPTGAFTASATVIMTQQ